MPPFFFFLSEAHAAESAFTSSDLEIQSTSLQYHSKHRCALICRARVSSPTHMHVTVNLHVSVVVLLGTSWGVCSVSHSPLQLFFFSSYSPPSTLLLLLVCRHISIFISRLPQLSAVKCLQAFFFFCSFFPPTLSLSASIFSPRACFMHKEGYLTSDVIHVHEWNTTKKSIISLLILPTSNFLNVPVLIR